jgi:hypothetical protein
MLCCTSPVSRVPSRVLGFDGEDDWLRAAGGELAGLQNAITVEAWFFPQRKRRNGHTEVCVLSQGSWEGRFKLSILPNGHIRWTVRTQSGEVADCDGREAIQYNRWYHVAAVYSDTGGLDLYLNGASEQLGASSCSRELHGPLANTGGH